MIVRDIGLMVLWLLLYLPQHLRRLPVHLYRPSEGRVTHLKILLPHIFLHNVIDVHVDGVLSLTNDWLLNYRSHMHGFGLLLRTLEGY